MIAANGIVYDCDYFDPVHLSRDNSTSIEEEMFITPFCIPSWPKFIIYLIYEILFFLVAAIALGFSIRTWKDGLLPEVLNY